MAILKRTYIICNMLLYLYNVLRARVWFEALRDDNNIITTDVGGQNIYVIRSKKKTENDHHYMGPGLR